MPGGIGWRWLIAALALAILTAACGSNSAPAPGAAGSHPASLNVELDWVPNPDHVGFYYAQHQGYFARQHLMVNFRVPSSAATRSSSSGWARPTWPSPTSRSSSTPSRSTCR